jgi:hypothetical protein
MKLLAGEIGAIPFSLITTEFVYIPMLFDIGGT